MKHVTITIKVAYDEATIRDEAELELALHREVDRAIGDGMLSPSWEEVVDELSVDVEMR